MNSGGDGVERDTYKWLPLPPPTPHIHTLKTYTAGSGARDTQFDLTEMGVWEKGS